MNKPLATTIIDSTELDTVTGGADSDRFPGGGFENPPGMIGQPPPRKPHSVWKSRKPQDAWDVLIFR